MNSDGAGGGPVSAEMIEMAMDCLGAAVTIVDQNGTLLYYNRHAAVVLDRKPEYIGADVHTHHKRVESNEKLDRMLRAFREGRRRPFRYEAEPYGEVIVVTLSPLLKNGRFMGCVQTVVGKEELSLKGETSSGRPGQGGP